MARLIALAPTITEHLCDDCQAHFDGLLAHLEPLSITPRLAHATGARPGLLTHDRLGVLPSRRGRPAAGVGRRGALRRTRWSCWAARPPRASASASASTAWPWRSRNRVTAPVLEPWRPAVVVVGADPRGTRSRASRWRRAPRCRPRPAGRTSTDCGAWASSWRVPCVPAHTWRSWCGDELDEGHLQVKDLKAGTKRLVAVADLARELQRAQNAPSRRRRLRSPVACP